MENSATAHGIDRHRGRQSRKGPEKDGVKFKRAFGSEATVVVRVIPKYSNVWKAKFKNGFQRMRLICGSKEVPPIDPGKAEYKLLDLRGHVIDTTTQGLYVYSPDAISPSCGGMSLEIFSEKDPDAPTTQPLEAATVEHVWADFEPYRKAKK